MIEHQIESLLAVKFQEEEFQDCFLIEVNHHPGNKLEVFIDSDFGVTFDKCHKVSRYLESIIDEQGWLGEKYVLEVSSPGIGRPLKLPRQYLRNIGRTLEITLADGQRKEGILAEAHDTHIVLDEVVVERDGKKKKKIQVQTPIPFEQIKTSIVKISFK